MSVNKINPVYTTKTKQSGDPLTHNEWNDISSAVNEVQVKVNDIIENGVGSGEGSGTSSNTSEILTVNNKHNVTLGGNSIKNVNIEPGYPNTDTSKYGDIALKPGDDIQFASHHREPKKRDKIVVKNIDGSDNPVKLQVVAGEMELAVGTANNPKTATKKKDKTTGNDTENAMFKASDAKTLDIKILTGNVLDVGGDNERDERAYLKVRAQAIDLRCEKHGGIALLPKGYDGDGNMNKIKFEHGGGDGLEFGTFNTEKTSIYTDEYRFKKKGVWKMATRTTEASGKDIIDENTPVGKTATGALKYVKQADDFYDIISNNDALCTTEDIIKTAHAFNNDRIETGISSSGNLKISSSNTYRIVEFQNYTPGMYDTFDSFYITKFENLTKDELKLIVSNNVKLSDYIGTDTIFQDGGGHYYVLQEEITPNISLESESKVVLDAEGDVEVNSGDTIKMEAPEIRMNAINSNKSGGIVNFGATLNIKFLTKKLTKSLNVESSENSVSIKVQVLNNSSKTVYYDNTTSKFEVLVEDVYLDANHSTILTPQNYAEGLNVYSYDGTLIPLDSTWFMACLESGYYNIYKVGTKGSSPVLKKTLGEPVAVYDSSFNEVSNTISDITFKQMYSGIAQEVLPGEFITLSEVNLDDIIMLVSYFKNLNEGPWHL